MQDALPAFVLDSDATKRSAMKVTPRNPDADQPATPGSDEQLMVAFCVSGYEPALRNPIDAEMLLRQAVGKLERLDREGLFLREFEQLSYAEIADLLSLPVTPRRLRRRRVATHGRIPSAVKSAGHFHFHPCS